MLLVAAEYRKSDQQYTEIQNDYIIITTSSSEQLREEEIAPDSEKLTAPITVDFERLLRSNGDVVGWLYCENSVINYPVVQGNDNDEYLHKGLDGEYLRSGTLFVEAHNQTITWDPNYIIYGHSMKNGSMFGMLLHYKKQSYYDANPVMYYLTPEADYRIELFAGKVVKTTDPIYSVKDGSAEFYDHVQAIRDKSTFHSDVTFTEQDTIVTLSTCSYEFDQARYVVLGKLVPIE